MKINHITILVRDNKKAAEFYSNILEFGKIKIVRNKHYWVQIGDVYIHLAMNSGEPVKDSFYHFAVEIDDLEAYVRMIESKGVHVRKDNEQFFIRDLDDNLIELIDSQNNFFK